MNIFKNDSKFDYEKKQNQRHHYKANEKETVA